MYFAKLFVSIVVVLFVASSGYPLQMVRERGRLVFYDERHLKVKAYYIANNRIRYIYRYYYDKNKMCIKQEVWHDRTLMTVLLYTYYRNSSQLKSKTYYYKNKFKYRINYDRYGSIIEKLFKEKDDTSLSASGVLKAELEKVKEKKVKEEEKKVVEENAKGNEADEEVSNKESQEGDSEKSKDEDDEVKLYKEGS